MKKAGGREVEVDDDDVVEGEEKRIDFIIKKLMEQ